MKDLKKKIKGLYLSNLDYVPREIESTISCFCYNLIRMVKFEYDLCHIIMKRSGRVPRAIVNGEVICKPPSQTNTVNLVALLDRLDLLYLYKGYNVHSDCKELSYFCLSDELIDMVKTNVNLSRVRIQPYEDVVILKNEDKKQIEYLRTPKTRGMIKQVRDFNKVLLSHDIRCEGESVTVSFKRVFNNNSFELGGRFYTHSGEIQTVSSNKRKLILIDGEKAGEADFKALHLSLLYELCGEHMLEGFDPYNANLTRCARVFPDEIAQFVADNNLDTSYNPIRNLCKIASLIMVNSKNDRETVAALRTKVLKDMRKKGTSDDRERVFVGLDFQNAKLDKIIEALSEHNKSIDQYFNSGYGVNLQYQDSQIMSGVIQDFIEAGKVCIPVHDSAITKKSDISFLIESMHSNYERVMGSKNNCFVEVKW
jgi:hypothetical protein